MLPSVPALALRVRDRIEAKAARHGLVYPWWIPTVTTAGMIAGALLGAAQRGLFVPPDVALVAVLLVGAPSVAHFVVRPWLPWWVEVVLVTSGTAWLLGLPTDGSTIDAVPFVLAVLVGEVTATEGGRRGLVAAGVSVVALVALVDLDADLTTLYLAELLFGLVVGHMLRWQMRALAAEHAARDEEAERATLAERQRVAREIHDLVAHSLSVTMLHVTGARRALTEDADVAEAVEALTDAERIGRQAMADIRRTVSVLSTPAADLRPLPGAADVEALVADVRGAGLGVDFSAEGDLTRLSGAAGLGVYRVVQESLANVARHAAGAPASVRLLVEDDVVRLSVTNPLVGRVLVGAGGSGVTGMTSRVDQLGGRLDVGPDDAPDGRRWRVDLVVPLDASADAGHACVIRRLL